jgi:predicted enzyme related to lactoylglutathione lyase
MPGFTGIGWFDIGTDDPAAAGRFSGEVSGWTVAPEDAAATGRNYRIVTTGDQEGLHGGLFATRERCRTTPSLPL